MTICTLVLGRGRGRRGPSTARISSLSKSKHSIGANVSSDSVSSNDSLGTGFGFDEDGSLRLFLSFFVALEGSGSGSGSFTFSFIGGSLCSDGGSMSSDGTFLMGESFLLSGLSSLMVVRGSFVGNAGRFNLGISLSKDLSGSFSFGVGILLSFVGSVVLFLGDPGGDLGGVPSSESLLLDGKGSGGGFSGLQVSGGGSDLSGKRFLLGSGHIVVMSDGVFVLSDRGQPFGVPLSLESDLLGSSVFSREVEVGSGTSCFHTFLMLSNEKGTSGFSFRERGFVHEERIIGESSVDGFSSGFRVDGYSFFGSSDSGGGADTFFDVFVSFLSLAFGLHVAVVIALLASTGVVDLVGLTTPVIRAWA